MNSPVAGRRRRDGRARKQVLFYLDPETDERVAGMAAQLGVSKSEFVEQLLTRAEIDTTTGLPPWAGELTTPPSGQQSLQMTA